ncbi:MAG: hypothetical protein EVA65_16495 [Oceanococcus sp.]|nr:MAG: hypothetical protein EVA65_16495 [Oceanococcus sp.]
MIEPDKAFYAPPLLSDAPPVVFGNVRASSELEQAVTNLANDIERDAKDGQLQLIDERAEWARILCIIICDSRRDADGHSDAHR